MRRYGVIALATLFFVACGDSGEKKAAMRLNFAEKALQRGDFSEAKLQLDSIKTLYPKAFEARKKGLSLMLQVELNEQQKTVLYLDSMLAIKQKKVDLQKHSFAFEKNSEYQTVGNYFHPSQLEEKNTSRTYLRAQVDENGVFTLTSIYKGKVNIHHHAIKVTLDDGSFAQTPISRDVYEDSYLGQKVEKVDYLLGKDGGVANFINEHKNQKIRLEFIGSTMQVINLSVSDSRAISEVYNLAQAIFGVEQIKKELKESNLKIRFINKRIQLSSVK